MSKSGQSEQEALLIHKDKSTGATKSTAITFQQDQNNSIKQVSHCEECDQNISFHVRSKRSLRMRFVLLMLPSLIIGGYFIVERAISQGLDTLILSIILYTVFGFIGYIIVMLKIFPSFFAMTSSDDDTHTITVE